MSIILLVVSPSRCFYQALLMAAAVAPLVFLLGGGRRNSLPVAADVWKPASPGQARLELLIEQLGDDSFRERDAAQRELATYGPHALELLTKTGLKHMDLEIRMRSEKLLADYRQLAHPTGGEWPSIFQMPSCPGGDSALKWYMYAFRKRYAYQARPHLVWICDECAKDATRLMAEALVDGGIDPRAVKKLVERAKKANKKASFWALAPVPDD